MEKYDDVMQSYGRCCRAPTFFEDFYESFLNSSAAVREKFRHTDMSNQRQLLRQGIMNLVLYARGMPDTKLRHLGMTHSRQGFDISPALYDLWVAALLATIKRHDLEFSPDLEKAWREVLSRGIAVIQSYY